MNLEIERYEGELRALREKSKSVDICCNGDCNQGRECPLRKERAERIDVLFERFLNWLKGKSA